MIPAPEVKELINEFLEPVPDDLNNSPHCEGHSPIAGEDTPLPDLAKMFQTYDAIMISGRKGNLSGCLRVQGMIQLLFSYASQLQAFYETVAETTEASVTVIDAAEKVRTWTGGAEKIFSVKRESILGKRITEFFERDSLEILESLQTGKSITGKYHQPREDLFVLINSNPVYCDGRIIGAVVSETDVTSQVIMNEKLFNMSAEVHRLEQQVAQYQDHRDPFHAIKGRSPALKKTIQTARKVCSVKSTVLILGESGVGKEVFAKAIHEASEKPNAPFISINCGAIPPSLFESELFGYEKGAFSGADQRGKKGKIELAQGGTLFLDEIGEMPLDMQVKLLRVLQERKYYRVGGEKEVRIDFRLIAATNRDLKQLMKEGSFREDLYYRLNVVGLRIPPLRDRPEDIIELVHHFINELSFTYQRPILQFPQEIVQELMKHEWPGNIRELRNVAERLVVFATDGKIRKEYLPFSPPIQSADTLPASTDIREEPVRPILTLQEEMDRHEKKVLERALSKTDGNKLECARLLGITRATLYNRLRRLQ